MKDPGDDALLRRQAEWARQAAPVIDWARAYVRWRTEGGPPNDEPTYLWTLLDLFRQLPDLPGGKGQ